MSFKYLIITIFILLVKKTITTSNEISDSEETQILNLINSPEIIEDYINTPKIKKYDESESVENTEKQKKSITQDFEIKNIESKKSFKIHKLDLDDNSLSSENPSKPENSEKPENPELLKIKEDYFTYKYFLKSLELEYKQKQKKTKNSNLQKNHVFFLYKKTNLDFVLKLEDFCLKNIYYKICMKWSGFVLKSLKTIPFLELLQRIDYLGIFVKKLSLSNKEFWEFYYLFKDSDVFNNAVVEGQDNIFQIKEFFNVELN